MTHQAILGPSAKADYPQHWGEGNTPLWADMQIPGGIIGPRPNYDYHTLIAHPVPTKVRNERRKFPRMRVAGTLVFGGYNLPVKDISGTGMKLAHGCTRSDISLRPFPAELFFVAEGRLFKQRLVVEFVDRDSPSPSRLHIRVVLDNAEPVRAVI